MGNVNAIEKPKNISKSHRRKGSDLLSRLGVESEAIKGGRLLQWTESQATAWSGNEAKAERFFAAFRDEIEVLELDEFGTHDAVINLDELVDTLTRKLDNPELLQRTRVQARRFGFGKWYKNLFSTMSAMLVGAAVG